MGVNSETLLPNKQTNKQGEKKTTKAKVHEHTVC